MTSQVISSMPSVGVRFPDAAATPAVVGISSAPVIGAAASWRRKGSVKTFVGLCWTLGTCATFLTVGVVGMFAADVPWYELKTLEALADVEDLDPSEAAMAEFQSELPPADTIAEEPETPPEILDLTETPPEVQDLPDLVAAMTEKDIFAIPSAPRIEEALRPVDPVAKTKPKPTPTKARGPVSKPGGGTGALVGRQGGAGGVPGGAGTGTGTGKLIKPDPPYPSFARSAGMQGSASVIITFGVSGRVESASIVSSTGYSGLDSHTTSWIQRKWYYQGGLAARKSVKAPIKYHLR